MWLLKSLCFLCMIPIFVLLHFLAAWYCVITCGSERFIDWVFWFEHTINGWVFSREYGDEFD